MLRFAYRVTLFASLVLTTAACTQAPAQIDLRGQNNYNRNTGGGYASNAPASTYSSYQPAAGGYASTQSSAAVSSIGVSDLSSPASTKSSYRVPHVQSSAAPFKPASAPLPVATAKVTPKPAISSENVNPWTGKPRDTAASSALDESFSLRPQPKAAGAAKEPMVSEIKKPAEVKAAKLDSIVANDEDNMKKSVAITAAPVKADVAANNGSFMWPVNSKKVLSQYGPKGKGKVNDGINIASGDGEPVWAAADGEVVYVGNELAGYGNMVLIKHNGNKATTYAHLNRATVDKYDRVKQGDIIGYVGSTGNVKEPQLHFAIRDGKDPVDPMKFFNRKVASLR